MRLRLDPDHAQAPLAAMPPLPRRRMRRVFERLRSDPTGRANDLDVKRLHADGESAFFRLRVGVWRAVFTVHADEVRVMRVFARDEGYGWLDRLRP